VVSAAAKEGEELDRKTSFIKKGFILGFGYRNKTYTGKGDVKGRKRAGGTLDFEVFRH